MKWLFYSSHTFTLLLPYDFILFNLYYKQITPHAFNPYKTGRDTCESNSLIKSKPRIELTISEQILLTNSIQIKQVRTSSKTLVNPNHMCLKMVTRTTIETTVLSVASNIVKAPCQLSMVYEIESQIGVC